MSFLDSIRGLGATIRAWRDFASLLDRLNVASEEEAKATLSYYAKHPANVFNPPGTSSTHTKMEATKALAQYPRGSRREVNGYSIHIRQSIVTSYQVDHGTVVIKVLNNRFLIVNYYFEWD